MQEGISGALRQPGTNAIRPTAQWGVATTMPCLLEGAQCQCAQAWVAVQGAAAGGFSWDDVVSSGERGRKAAEEAFYGIGDFFKWVAVQAPVCHQVQHRPARAMLSSAGQAGIWTKT